MITTHRTLQPPQSHSQPPRSAPSRRRAPAANAGRGAGRGPMIPPLEETGFQPIFDGKSLTGWDGDPEVLARRRTAPSSGRPPTDNQPEQNTFLHLARRQPGRFRIEAAVQADRASTAASSIRSIELPDIKWVMKGYQADMDGAQQYTGQIYEERGRGFLAMRGQFSYIGEGKKPGAGRLRRRQRRAEEADQGRRLERSAHHRPRQHDHPAAQRPRHEHADRRRYGRPQDGRPDRHPVPQGTADEDRSRAISV